MQRKMPGIRDQRGFTLIEIIMVIVLLGIIAAIAIPKYVDLKSSAQTATADGLKGAITSAAAIGYAYKAVNEPTATYPTMDEIETTYLQSDDLKRDGATNQFTASIGAKVYTFTYYQGSGAAARSN